MAVRKRHRRQNSTKNACMFVFELDDECKMINKTLVITDQRNMLLAVHHVRCIGGYSFFVLFFIVQFKCVL